MIIAESFSRSGLAKFINSPVERIARVVAGLALVVWGYTSGGIVLIIIGLIPLAAEALDLCLVSALLGRPISGKKVRGTKP